MMRSIKRAPLFILCMLVLLSLAVLTVFSPRRTRSDMENRVLAEPVAVTAEGVLSGDVTRQTEDYLTDHFIGRDLFILVQNGLDAVMLRTEKNGILLGERLMADTRRLQTYVALENAKAMGGIAAAAHADTTVVIAPLSSAVTPERLPPFYRPADQKALLEELYAQSGLDCLDTLSALLPLGEAAYYRSDPHWTADGAMAVYVALCEAWGIVPKTDVTRVTAGGFFGSYYAQTPRPFFPADTFTFDGPEGVSLVIEGETKPGLLDEAQLAGRDKYAAILYGNPARGTLEGPGEGVLLVVKDSFANALLPLLAQHFARVETFDPRYTMQPIPEACADAGADRLLFVYGLKTLLGDRNLIMQTELEAE
jgi:hypothetical protein